MKKLFVTLLLTFTSLVFVTQKAYAADFTVTNMIYDSGASTYHISTTFNTYVPNYASFIVNADTNQNVEEVDNNWSATNSTVNLIGVGKISQPGFYYLNFQGHISNTFYINGNGNFDTPPSPSPTDFAPVINSIANETIFQGDTYTASSSFTDPDSTSWTATVDYGDGTGTQPLTLNGQNFTLNHTYNRLGTSTITVSITDNQGLTGQEGGSVTVNTHFVVTNMVYDDNTSTYHISTQFNASAFPNYPSFIVNADTNQNAEEVDNNWSATNSVVNLIGVGKITQAGFYYLNFKGQKSNTFYLNGNGNYDTPPSPTPTPTPTLLTAIDAGGDIQGSYVADTDYSQGTTYSSSASVDTSGVSNPAPEAVYQTVRYGDSFSYSIPNLTANGTYTIRLHFNELYWGTLLAGNSGGVGSRIFNVKINQNPVLSNYDIYEKAGGANKAIVEQLPATADNNGNITINFDKVTDNALVNGIEIYNGTLPSPSPTPTPTPASDVLINTGGNANGNFVADTDYSGGTTYTSTDNVDTTSVTNPAPQAVYQTVRYGDNFKYIVPNLVPNTSYLVRLHFNELYWGTPLAGNSGGVGSRVFNVIINNTPVLNNFDIYQTAGGGNKAIVEEFTEPSDSQGKMTIQFSKITDNAMVNGIELHKQ